MNFSKINKFLFLWALCFVINIITLLFIYYKIGPGGKTLALKYNVLEGVENYGKGSQIYYIPLTAFFITAINFVLYNYLKKNENFLLFLTIFASLFIQIVLLAAAISLKAVN